MFEACTPRGSGFAPRRVAATGAFVPPPIVEPAVTSEGLDANALSARYPGGCWLPLSGPTLDPGLIVNAELNGHAVDALLDTGSTSSLIGERLARSSGVIQSDRWLQRYEASVQGRTFTGDAYRAEVRLGEFVFGDVKLNVLPGSDFDLVVGFAELRQIDVLVASDDRMIGFFAAGSGPVPDGAQPIEFVEHADGVAYVDAWVPAPDRTRYLPAVPLLIDTGATTTGIPRPAIDGQRRLHESRSVTADGSRLLAGHFDVGELLVGRRQLRVGPVIANDGRAGYGNLGLDVLRRYQALFSARRSQLFLAPRARRPELRTLGPGGKPCLRNGAATPCVSIKLVQQPRAAKVCATIAPGYGELPLALEVGAERADGAMAWGGGAFTIYLRGPGAWQTICEQLPVIPAHDRVWDLARLALNHVYRPRDFPCGNRSSCASSRSPLP